MLTCQVNKGQLGPQEARRIWAGGDTGAQALLHLQRAYCVAARAVLIQVVGTDCTVQVCSLQQMRRLVHAVDYHLPACNSHPPAHL